MDERSPCEPASTERATKLDSNLLNQLFQELPSEIHPNDLLTSTSPSLQHNRIKPLFSPNSVTLGYYLGYTKANMKVKLYQIKQLIFALNDRVQQKQ